MKQHTHYLSKSNLKVFDWTSFCLFFSPLTIILHPKFSKSKPEAHQLLHLLPVLFHKVFQVSPFFSFPFSSASVHYQMHLAFNSGYYCIFKVIIIFWARHMFIPTVLNVIPVLKKQHELVRPWMRCRKQSEKINHHRRHLRLNSSTNQY